MPDNFTNFYSSQIMAAVDGDDTSIVVLDAAGAPSAPQFRVVVQDAADSISNRELMIVTAVSGTTFTVTRAAEGMSGVSHVSGSFIAHVLTAGGLVNSIGNVVMVNEIINFPSIEGADASQPEWWEESGGTATLTEEDVAGESITETWERTLKLVTTADVYAYQTLTYADQPRLKSGRKVSARVAVWSVGGATARVRIQDTVGSLGVATTTAASWTILTVEGVTLGGTAVDLRLEVNNGTAYFVPLAFGVGSFAPIDLPPRGLRYRHREPAQLVDFAGAADPAVFTDVDCTSNSSPLAAVAELTVEFVDTSATGWDFFTRKNGSSGTGNAYNRVSRTNNASTFRVSNSFREFLDDQQIFEYMLDRWTGSGTIDDGLIVLNGWHEWE